MAAERRETKKLENEIIIIIRYISSSSLRCVALKINDALCRLTRCAQNEWTSSMADSNNGGVADVIVVSADCIMFVGGSATKVKAGRMMVDGRLCDSGQI